MGLAALQSIVRDDVSSVLGCSIPPRRHRFRSALAVFQPSPSAEDFRIRLILSCALPSLQSLRTNAGPALTSGRLPWASFPHRDINRRSPRSRASQARFVPSSTFRTSSTACSSAGLAGLFHPAATSRVRSSGCFPREKPHELVARRCPHVVGAKSLPGCPGSRTSCPAFRALLLSRIRSRHTVVEAVCARYPPELRPPSGPSSRTVPAIFTASSDHGLSRPSSSRPCATWLALASPPPPFEVPGLRRHHNLRCSFAARPRSPSDPLRPPTYMRSAAEAGRLDTTHGPAKDCDACCEPPRCHHRAGNPLMGSSCASECCVRRPIEPIGLLETAWRHRFRIALAGFGASPSAGSLTTCRGRSAL